MKVAVDDVVLPGKRKEQFQVVDVELAVTVGVEDPLLAGAAEPALQGCTVAFVPPVMHDPDPPVLLGQAVGYPAGPVGAPVVDEDNLIVQVQPLKCRDG